MMYVPLGQITHGKSWKAILLNHRGLPTTRMTQIYMSCVYSALRYETVSDTITEMYELNYIHRISTTKALKKPKNYHNTV